MLKVGDIYYLFGEASNLTPQWWINIKKSWNGIEFTDAGSALLDFGGVGEFDEAGQADPSVIYEGVGDWKMWFDALNGSGVWDKLGYATSIDGVTWNKVGSVLDRGAAGAWDDNLIHHPAVIKHNGIYYMFYAAVQAPSTVKFKIGLATSTDGINWAKEPTNPVIDVGDVGQFDSTYVRPSNPVRIGNIWYMWYWGNNGTSHSIGLATSPDLITWTKQGVILAGASASWVRLVEGSNGADKIAQIYYVNSSPAGTNLAKATIANAHTYIDKFKKDEVKYGDIVKGTTNTTYAANYIYGGRVTVASACTPNKIRLYVSAASKPITGKVQCALYTDGGNTPTTLIAITNEKDWSDVLANGWTEFEFISPPSLSAGEYWAVTNSEQAYRREREAGGSNNWFNKAQAYGTWPTITTPSLGSFSGNDIHIVEENALNIWEVSLVSEPINIYFNNIKGTKVVSKALINSEFDWYWNGGVLYIYGGGEHPDIRYVITYE